MTSAVRSITSLACALRAAWAADTSTDSDGWSLKNPAWGQCAVTALVVQDELGGELLRSPVAGGSHYWNRLPDGTELDLTREQFSDNFIPTDVAVRDREYVLSFGPTRRRYELLCARIQSIDAVAAA